MCCHSSLLTTESVWIRINDSCKMNKLASSMPPTTIILSSSSAFEKEAAPEGRKYRGRRTVSRTQLPPHVSQEPPKTKECSPCHIQATPKAERTPLFFRDVNSAPHGAYSSSSTDTTRNLSLAAVNEVQPKIMCIQDVFETENNFVLRPRLPLSS